MDLTQILSIFRRKSDNSNTEGPILPPYLKGDTAIPPDSLYYTSNQLTKEQEENLRVGTENPHKSNYLGKR